MQQAREAGGQVHVIYLTDGDGYPEGVRYEDHVESPTARDYRGYGRERKQEARAALTELGFPKGTATFLSFPDGGLSPLMKRYWSEKRAAFRSPYTRMDRPPKSDIIVADTEYRGEDLTQELARAIGEYRPTLVLVPRKEDQHADHCASWFFLMDALEDVERVHPEYSPDVVNYIVHWYSWPFEDERRELAPPPGLRGGASGWMVVPLTRTELRTQACGAAALSDASARDAVVPRRLRAIERSLLPSGAVEGRPAHAAKYLRRLTTHGRARRESNRSTRSAALRSPA